LRAGLEESEVPKTIRNVVDEVREMLEVLRKDGRSNRSLRRRGFES
jgi:hypothetical protein